LAIRLRSKLGRLIEDYGEAVKTASLKPKRTRTKTLEKRKDTQRRKKKKKKKAKSKDVF
jgi:hypothetical protein